MSKKYTLVEFTIQDGEEEYKKRFPFFTSDFQKMTDEQLIAYFFTGNKDERLDLFEDTQNIYWINNMERTVYVSRTIPINMTEFKLLQKIGIVNFLPHDNEMIYKKPNNIVQFPKRA
jgi:hypothetical protein